MASPTGRGESGNGKDQTLEVGTALLKDFIHERVQRHGDSNTEVTRAQLGERELSESERKIVQQLGEMVRILGQRLFREQAARDRILSAFDTPTCQTLAVFLAGVLTTFLVTEGD